MIEQADIVLRKCNQTPLSNSLFLPPKISENANLRTFQEAHLTRPTSILQA